jgi:hypothetical protein
MRLLMIHPGLIAAVATTRPPPVTIPGGQPYERRPS